MTLPQPLIDAYLATEYRVLGEMPGAVLLPFTIRIGQAAPEADQRLRQLGLDSWGFITAANPRSQPHTDSENQLRQQQLRTQLLLLSLLAYPAVGIDPQSDWPGEPSYWVPGISQTQLLTLAESFEQFAVVYGQLDQAAVLLTTSLVD